jgi:TatD DNase family protein
MCAASAAFPEEFAYNAELSRLAAAEGAAPVLLCFAVHPQMPVTNKGGVRDGLAALESLAGQGRLAAVGETGFDLYNAAYRATEGVQDELFAAHLETALRYGLPLVLHARKAMRKVFAHAGALKKCRAVIFHSWPGTLGEGESLLKRGINAFFSFGTAILLNHREAMRCCAAFPLTRLLAETDAPYQPPRGGAYSSWRDLPRIIAAASALRREPVTAPGGLEHAIAANFHAAFCIQ